MANTEQEGSGQKNISSCRGFAVRKALLKPLGEQSQSSPRLRVETLFLFQASDCKMLGTLCSLCKLAEKVERNKKQSNMSKTREV